MKIIYSDSCLEYGLPGHPESPERIRSIQTFLTEKGFSFLEPIPCKEEDLIRVHSEEMVRSIQSGSFFDADTPSLPGIYNHAILSAGAAIQATDESMKGETCFSLMRPPGHHATKNRIMGFCYFNSIAVASFNMVFKNPEHKIAILDIDCHHGNGTEDIVRGNPSFCYVSLHQSPLYPGTGLQSNENCFNFPLQPGTTESEYLDTLEQACRKVEDFNSTLLGISAGFDTYQGDPITQLGLVVSSYEKIGKTIGALGLPTFIVMEGGYSRELPQCVHGFIQGMDR